MSVFIGGDAISTDILSVVLRAVDVRPVRNEMRECRCVDDVDDASLAGVAGPAAGFTSEVQATARYFWGGPL